MENDLRFNVQDVPGHANHLVVTSFISDRIKAKTLLDTGASSPFISSNFVRTHNLPRIKLSYAKTMRMANGSPVEITEAVNLIQRIGTHTDQCLHYITPIHNYDIVLGMSWLEEHNPDIDFSSRTINFNKHACLAQCLPGKPCLIAVDHQGHVHQPELNNKDLDICTVSAAAFIKLARKRKHETGALWPEDLKDGRDEHLRCFAISPEDYDKFMTQAEHVDPKVKLPEEYHDFTDVFKHKDEFKLPPHKGVDHPINLKPGTEPPYKKAFPINPAQLAAVKKYIDEELAKGTIEASNSPCASPVLIVRKPNGGLRVCMDYRALNAITVKDRYPIPLIKETLDRLCKAKIFTKLDIVAAFNNMRIREGDEWMTAFITRYGLY